MNGEHRYHVTVDWTGNTGTGTSSYKAYSRDHLIQAEGKPDVRVRPTRRSAAIRRAGIPRTCWWRRWRRATSFGICISARSKA